MTVDIPDEFRVVGVDEDRPTNLEPQTKIDTEIKVYFICGIISFMIWFLIANGYWRM